MSTPAEIIHQADEVIRLEGVLQEQKRRLHDSIRCLETDDDTLLSLAVDLYWTYTSVKLVVPIRKLVVERLGGKVWESRVMTTDLPWACSDCGELYVRTFTSRTQYKEDKKSGRGRCPDCQERRKEQSVEQDRQWEVYRRERQEQKKARLQVLREMPYREYLQTPEWDATRKTAYRRAGYRCQLCNSSGVLNVHHKTYENRGCEKDADLIVLCNKCHAKFHEV
jgi:5-methylcytosine-specific restriction endonuclease McrA